MGISTAFSLASSSTGPADFTPSVTCVVLAAASASDMPRAGFSPVGGLAARGRAAVAHRVPPPRQARERGLARAEPRAAPGDLGGPRGDQHGGGVAPQPHADGNAARDRDHVLDPPAELTPD